ncbi:MAG: dihydroorotate dehydrogenase [Thermoplasmatota archaeon]
MAAPSLETEIAGLKLRNPLMLASGIADETGASMAEAVKRGAGAVVTKSLSLESREGHPNPCIVELPFGLINAMGLPNPGIKEYGSEIKEYRKLIGSRAPVIGSVFGSTIEEYGLAAKGAQEIGVDAVEINGSCPNAKGLGLQFGQDPEVIDELIMEVRSRIDLPLFFKLTPATSNILSLAEAAQEAGADGIVAVNTMPAMEIDIHTGAPILTNLTGGLSGPALRPIGIRCVFEICRSPEIKIPVIGAGGISGWEDALQYLMAGASAVQIGTAVTWSDLDIFNSIRKGFVSYLEQNDLSSIEDVVGAALEVEE